MLICYTVKSNFIRIAFRFTLLGIFQRLGYITLRKCKANFPPKEDFRPNGLVVAHVVQLLEL